MQFQPTAALYDLDRLPFAITVLPLTREGQRGRYSDDAADLPKLLRASNLEAGFLHDPADREWRVYMGEVLIELVIGVASSLLATATWQTLGVVLRNQIGKKRARVTLVEMDADGARWFEAEGDGDVITQSLEMFAKKQRDQ